MGLYFVPAGLYCIYNNLAFVNLANYDPTTYFLLLQMRTVVTGVMFQLLFRKVLSRKQWVSLGLLTLGCIIKEYRWQETAAEKVWCIYFSSGQRS
jgi:integrin beta 8